MAAAAAAAPSPQPPTVVCKAKTQLDYIHISYTCFARLAQICMLSRCLLKEISASELSRKFTKTALLVGPPFPVFFLRCATRFGNSQPSFICCTFFSYVLTRFGISVLVIRMWREQVKLFF